MSETNLLYGKVAEAYRELEFNMRLFWNRKEELNKEELKMLRKAYVDMVAFGCDLDTDDILSPEVAEEDWQRAYKIVKEDGRISCGRLKCPFRKKPK